MTTRSKLGLVYCKFHIKIVREYQLRVNRGIDIEIKRMVFMSPELLAPGQDRAKEVRLLISQDTKD